MSVEKTRKNTCWIADNLEVGQCMGEKVEESRKGTKVGA